MTSGAGRVRGPVFGECPRDREGEGHLSPALGVRRAPVMRPFYEPTKHAEKRGKGSRNLDGVKNWIILGKKSCCSSISICLTLVLWTKKYSLMT